MATAKRQIAADTIHNTPAVSVDESISLLDQAMHTDEYAEGIAAFNDGRPPNF